MDGTRGLVGNCYFGRGFDLNDVRGEVEVGIDLEAEFGWEEQERGCLLV